MCTILTMTPRKKANEKIRISAEVPAADYRALELEAEENGRSLASETRIAIANHLKAVGRRPA